MIRKKPADRFTHDAPLDFAEPMPDRTTHDQTEQLALA